jgi:hypothetical protein
VEVTAEGPGGERYLVYRDGTLALPASKPKRLTDLCPESRAIVVVLIEAKQHADTEISAIEAHVGRPLGDYLRDAYLVRLMTEGEIAVELDRDWDPIRRMMSHFDIPTRPRRRAMTGRRRSFATTPDRHTAK